MVDAADRDRLNESKEELDQILNTPELAKVFSNLAKNLFIRSLL